MNTVQTYTRTHLPALTAANALSLSRVLLAPLPVIAFLHERFIAAAWLVMLLGLTDLLDGRIARWTGTVSRAGAVLDVVADCTVVFALQIAYIVTGVWKAYVLVASLLSIASFVVLTRAGRPTGRTRLGRYTGAALFVACAAVPLCHAIDCARWPAVCTVVSPLVAAYLAASVGENLLALTVRRASGQTTKPHQGAAAR